MRKKKHDAVVAVYLDAVRGGANTVEKVAQFVNQSQERTRKSLTILCNIGLLERIGNSQTGLYMLQENV